MTKEKYLELKVGGLVLVSFVLLAAFILSIGDFSIFEEGKTLNVTFEFANGLKRSAPVRVAGVDAGVVKDVQLFFDSQENKTKVNVVVWVRQETNIPIDSIAMINQLGLLGEKYLEIVPGLNMQKFFNEGDVLEGIDPILQEKISQRVVEVAAKLEDGIESINQLISDKGSQQALRNTLRQVSSLSEGLNEIINNGENQESVRLTLQRMSSLTERLDRIVQRIEAGEGTVGKLLAEERIYDDLQSLSLDLKNNPWKLLYRAKDKKD
ncbi:MAG: MCE family protein [Candidatus Omnitrophica bacterium]|nr:MCE family protein [Candidatus Omnitrophota bacterium]